jgi:hypothetical protein
MIACSAGIVDIATESRAGRFGVRISSGANNVSLLQNLHNGYGSHPASCSMDSMVFLAGLKRLRRDFEQSSSVSVEVTNEWSDTTTLSIRLHGMDRDNFVFMSASEKCTWMFFLMLLLFPNTAILCTILCLFCAVFHMYMS